MLLLELPALLKLLQNPDLRKQSYANTLGRLGGASSSKLNGGGRVKEEVVCRSACWVIC